MADRYYMNWLCSIWMRRRGCQTRRSMSVLVESIGGEYWWRGLVETRPPRSWESVKTFCTHNSINTISAVYLRCTVDSICSPFATSKSLIWNNLFSMLNATFHIWCGGMHSPKRTPQTRRFPIPTLTTQLKALNWSMHIIDQQRPISDNAHVSNAFSV